MRDKREPSESLEEVTKRHRKKRKKKLPNKLLNSGHGKNHTLKRRIKIRLADPNVPDSYICEIYDTSIEENNEPSVAQQPKSFFDVLMSNESRQSFNVISAIENDKISEDTKRRNVKEDGEVVWKRKKKLQKNKQVLEKMVAAKQRSLTIAGSSDEDETLFEVQSKLNNSVCKSTDKENNLKVDNEIKSPVIIVTPASRQGSNILNYFSKLGNGKKEKEKGGGSGSASRGKRKMQDRPKVETKNENTKLAPMFKKKEKIDHSVREARRAFLQSGPPMKMKVKGGEVCKDLHVNRACFPLVSHVQQRDDDVAWAARRIDIRLIPEQVAVLLPTGFHYQVPADEPAKPVVATKPRDLSEAVLREISRRLSSVDVNVIAGVLKGQKEAFARKEMEAQDANTSVEVLEETADGPNPLWLEKYRPNSAAAILGNRDAVAKMQRWLEAWKTHDLQAKTAAKTPGRERDSDSDDFVSSDDDARSRAPGTVCLLRGPVASGKTALVYALAAQLDLNVLEINASSKRTGSKLLADLQEATQSHKVQQTQPAVNPISSLVTGKKGRKKEEEEDRGGGREGREGREMSLILVEDCDVVFEEHDSGFMPAVAALVHSSKRPVVLTWTHTCCPAMDRLAATHGTLQLVMDRPSVHQACSVLEVVSLLEKIQLDKEWVEELVRRNRADLRRCMQELQLWAGSGRREAGPALPGALWWGLTGFLYPPRPEGVVPTPSKRKRSPSDGEGAAKRSKRGGGDSVAVRGAGLAGLLRVSEAMCVADVLAARLRPWSELVTDGLSLAECMDACSFTETRLTGDLSRDVVLRSCDGFQRTRTASPEYPWSGLGMYPTDHHTRWQDDVATASKELQRLVPAAMPPRSVRVDYLPALRDICRSEKARAAANTKRKNRFCHYLRTVGGRLSEEKLDRSALHLT